MDLQSAYTHTFASWQCGLSGLQILIVLFGGLQIRRNTGLQSAKTQISAKTQSICSAGFAIRRFLIADLQSAHTHTFTSWLCGLSGLQILIVIFGGLQIRQNTDLIRRYFRARADCSRRRSARTCTGRSRRWGWRRSSRRWLSSTLRRLPPWLHCCCRYQALRHWPVYQ